MYINDFKKTFVLDVKKLLHEITRTKLSSGRHYNIL